MSSRRGDRRLRPGALGLIVVGFVDRLPVAFALGWLFVRRRSLWAPIGLHATFNAVLLILADLATLAGSVRPPAEAAIRGEGAR